MLDARRPGALVTVALAGSLAAQSIRDEDPFVVDAGTRARAMQEAADRGLAWLARQQAPGGYWSGTVGHKRGDGYMTLRARALNDAVGQGHMGVTALAGIAFLADGHMPGRGPYGDVVAKALDYVIEHSEETGMLTDGGTRMYSHAFATLFLAEIHGMAGGDRTREALERAVHLIVDSQNAHGGWRYNAFSPHCDLSVTVCQLQALRSARNIGISVSARTIRDAVEYVKESRTTSGRSKGLFYYKIYGRGAYRKNRDYAINAAALTSLFSAGVHEPEIYDPVLDFLADEYPTLADYYPTHFYYWYGNYYAAQAFFQAGGRRFEDYHERLSTDLLRMQRSDGRWVNGEGPGDEFSTAVACILLLIPKQYLPIFQR